MAATAPPFTFTMSSSTPSIPVVDRDRGERLVDLDEPEIGGSRALLSARSSAIAGTVWSEGYRSDDIPASISTIGSTPSSSAFSALITTTAQAPSEICDAFPAVIVPSGRNAGRGAAARPSCRA